MEEVIEKMEKFRENEYVQNYEREEALFRSNKNLWKKEGREEGIKVGKKEGKTEANYDTARKMLLNNKDIEEINFYTDIPIEKLNKLKIKLKEEHAKYGEKANDKNYNIKI
jgi:predicted transposase YdaD